MKASERLRAAKALIQNPASWCRGVREDAYRRRCAVGAIEHFTGWADTYHWLHTAAKGLFDRSVFVVNDDLGHAAVMQMYDAAIGLALIDECRIEINAAAVSVPVKSPESVK